MTNKVLSSIQKPEYDFIILLFGKGINGPLSKWLNNSTDDYRHTSGGDIGSNCYNYTNPLISAWR